MAFPLLPIIGIAAKVFAPALERAVAKAVNRGPDTKAEAAVVGGVAGVGTGGVGYLVLDALLGSFMQGALPELQNGVAMLGAAVAGLIVQYAIAWASPKNTES